MSAPVATCTVYFDGACPLCRREIAHYQSQEGAASIAWIDAASCDAAMLGADLGREAALARLHVRLADGSLVSGASAFAAMWTSLPAYRWLASIASRRLVMKVLEGAYSGFLRLRRLWRRPQPGTFALPPAVLAELRAAHTGEVCAVQFYRGILKVSVDGDLRAFAARHLAAEHLHLRRIRRWLPVSSRSRVLPAWRAAGWLTGAVVALIGRQAVFAAVAALERFADRHYTARIERWSAHPALDELCSTLAACSRRESVQRRILPVGVDMRAMSHSAER